MHIEPFKLERWLTKHELSVQYDITESGILPFSLEDIFSLEGDLRGQDTACRLLSMPLGYSEACGSLDLRTEIAGTYSRCSAGNILVTTGAIEANFLLFNVLLSQGDHVVCPYPAYQQLYSVPQAINCDVSLWRVLPEHDFTFRIEDLAGQVRSNTRLIVVNTPHNPTGAALSQAQMEEVCDIADRCGAWVMCDEAYRWLRIPGSSDLCEPVYNMYEKGISVGTMSKPFGLPGLRIGWMAGTEDIVEQCWAMRDYVSLSPGKIGDAAALTALRNKDRIIERNETIISANIERALTWAETNQRYVSWKPPQGGLLSMLQYHMDIPSEKLAGILASEYGVLLAPGSAFGFEGYLRLGLGQAPEVFAAGLEQAAACMRTLSCPS